MNLLSTRANERKRFILIQGLLYNYTMFFKIEFVVWQVF